MDDIKNTNLKKADLDRPRKKAISIRIDEDVLTFFQQNGNNYQGRINAVLRHFMTQVSKGKR